MTQSVTELGLPTPKERRRLREAADLTYEEVAAAVGVTSNTVRSWETGRTHPRGRKLEAYSKLLTRLAADASRNPAPAGPTAQAEGSTSQDGRERGPERGSERGSDQRSNRGSERGSDQGSNRGTDRASNRGTERGSDQRSNRGTDRASNQASNRGTDRGSAQGSDRGTDQGSAQGSDQGSDRGTDRGSAQGSDRGTDQGSAQGSDQGSDRRSDRRSNPGSDQRTDPGSDQRSDPEPAVAARPDRAEAPEAGSAADRTQGRTDSTGTPAAAGTANRPMPRPARANGVATPQSGAKPAGAPGASAAASTTGDSAATGPAGPDTDAASAPDATPGGTPDSAAEGAGAPGSDADPADAAEASEGRFGLRMMRGLTRPVGAQTRPKAAVKRAGKPPVGMPRHEAKSPVRAGAAAGGSHGGGGRATLRPGGPALPGTATDTGTGTPPDTGSATGPGSEPRSGKAAGPNTGQGRGNPAGPDSEAAARTSTTGPDSGAATDPDPAPAAGKAPARDSGPGSASGPAPDSASDSAPDSASGSASGSAPDSAPDSASCSAPESAPSSRPDFASGPARNSPPDSASAGKATAPAEPGEAAAKAGARAAEAGTAPGADPDTDPGEDAPKVTPASAFDALYDRTAPALARQAYLLTGRHALACEAVERAFQQAWDRWPEVATDPDPVGWVRAATYEYALSPWHRFRRSHRHPEEPPADPADRVLLDAMLELPPAHRRTVLLYDGVGLDLPDTAAETEASTPTAGSRLVNAHADLADVLPELDGVAPAKQSAVLRERLGTLRPPGRLEPRAAAAVRLSGEHRTRLWTRAVVGVSAVIAAATAYTWVTAPTEYEPPRAPGASVSGVPPHSGPQQLTDEGRQLHDKLLSDPSAGPSRISPSLE
ncbi:helix-turn-helix domain-containing protein [Streptomyces sp. NPDC099050]|uniref:helix-turn-helix domain-containing protein n=1 Tax=Streptomyces sp. NPDC099050 TaxID=3366100 RepID=UPI0038190DEA